MDTARHIAPGGIIVLLVLLALWVTQPIGVNAPRLAESDFDTGRATARLAMILGDETPHSVDTPANEAVRQRLLAQIRAAGFSPIERDQFYCNTYWPGSASCARVRNVAFWVGEPGDDAIALMAHYDSVAAGPGAADDGIGVAIALELAHVLARERLERPVLVLITDGEEAGLIGAAAFAAEDPLAARIGAVVNLEARGTTGIANMFQTSTPNSHDISALSGGTLPAANSLATNLYEIMPNDTDLSVMLPLGIDATNMAILGGGSRYHTPLDNLAHLDPRSVTHLGQSALTAARGFADGETGAETQLVFTDLMRLTLLAIPQWLAIGLLAIGLLGAAIVYWRASPGAPARAALAPPLALMAGVGLAVIITMLIAAIRPETSYASAYPMALRSVHAAAALTGAALVVTLFRVPPLRLTASAWAWLAIAVLAAFAFLPGLSTLAVWPMIGVAAAAACVFMAPLRKAGPVLFVVAAVLFALIGLPIAGGGEVGLFIENAAPLTIVLAFLYLFTLPRATWTVPAISGAVLVVAMIVTLIVPAFSVDKPRHLTVIHLDEDGTGSYLIPANGPVPPTMAEQADFERSADYPAYWRAPAPTLGDAGEASILSDTRVDGIRTIRLRLNGPAADLQRLVADGDARFVAINGTRHDRDSAPDYVTCTGQSCRTLEIEMEVDSARPAPTLLWQRYRYGAGPDAQRLVDTRPDTAQPVHTGDRRTLVRMIDLAAD